MNFSWIISSWSVLLVFNEEKKPLLNQNFWLKSFFPLIKQFIWIIFKYKNFLWFSTQSLPFPRVNTFFFFFFFYKQRKGNVKDFRECHFADFNHWNLNMKIFKKVNVNLFLRIVTNMWNFFSLNYLFSE